MKQYIEKAALMDHVERVGRRWGFDYDYEQILGDIEDFQTADVRPVVRGRWRKIGNNSDGTSDYECSACLGIMMHVPDDDEHPMVSFCSMCGADMREVET